MATIPEAFALALQHHQAGRLEAAEQIYRQILQADANHADARNLLGVIACQRGEYALAVEFIGSAIRLNREQPRFYNNLGEAYRRLGKSDEAAACLQRALRLDPQLAEAQYNLALVLNEQGQKEEAFARVQRAVQLQPGSADAYNNLGVALQDRSRFAEAFDCYQRALQLKPDDPEAHNNLGTLLQEQGKWDEALESYGQALRFRPDFAEPHRNRALVWLLQGNFEQGWPEYEWCWKRKPSARPMPAPWWDGSALSGRSILLHNAGGGFGDVFQFVRFVPRLKERGGTVIMACHESMTHLLASCRGIDKFTPEESQTPADLAATLSSLPGIFRPDRASTPADIPYLSADVGLVGRWKIELESADEGLGIGIAWQEGPKPVLGHARSVPLALFAALARLPGVRLFSLQKGLGTEQIDAARKLFPISDLSSRLDETTGRFMDTAAVMKRLDLIVTVDTAIAHLAGALGIPTWLTLSYKPEWRWLLEGEDSPWYPSMRLFRQSALGDWNGVFARVAEAVQELLTEKRNT